MSLLEITRLALLVAHFLGLAALIGPFLLQLRSREAFRLRLMLTGAIVQVVTGNALIAARRLQGLDVDEVKVIVKLGIALVALGALVAALIARRRRGADTASVRQLFHAAGGLGVTDVIVAVVWT
ncbi:hypothetical protein C1701_00260 [Actinoalloteichus sp. AHMU CJ021]|uniref:Integral membrane protein n=1 Tax=Actinoalloteichus caeruleus DSM 43889 TaxID=1120930 RepID=A0ABT1JEC6_ACTCY|nr:hypothetical protein [Actinoalloteichus caeruleus]AUS77043.1 hypothetical protein C1701_00260 [Actinoalloteichus sp. AHMU CJ021]MCP2330849.1 hypothetical protein [Actinoalloteichus caeruleus DSM 43889]